MIKSGKLRECPTCRHLTLKEKGLCNVIECAKCGVLVELENKRTRT